MGEWGNGGIHGLQSWPCHYLCCPDGRCTVLSSFVLIFDIFQCNVWNEWGMRKTLITGNRKLIHKRFEEGRWGEKQREKKKSTFTFSEEKSNEIIPSQSAIPFLENISRSQVRFISEYCLWCLLQLIKHTATRESSGQLDHFMTNLL